MTDTKARLHHDLRNARESLLWKLDGLGEYDLRRPMTPTGTNLLGLVKHIGGIEAGYLGEVLGRPVAYPPPWFADDPDEPNTDMWVRAEESSADVIDFYRRVWAHSDATIDALGLDAPGTVPWWPAESADVTLHQMIVLMIGETNRHGGHADIVRELIDGTVGLRPDFNGLPEGGEAWWADYRNRLEQSARRAAGR
ncbi:DinB family protein [Glycomyces luteolus]|uniref:DinB family protein n=1 Tax=Glycomyces luteolus TaxID=2670330 RepID=A0A9X3P5J5_9ACTN|nr:DinB family protein [Glycomyces luteolus]MDA1359061.1 DinB family protein [Glycomyces luteolus]